MRQLTLWALATWLLIGCCPVTSVHPLKPYPGEGLTDMAGIWQLDSKDDKVLLHIGQSTQDQWQVLLAEHKSDATLEHAGFLVTATSIGESHYLNLDLENVSPSRREGQEGNIILKVVMPDRYTLQLHRLNLEAVAAAILSGAVSGTIATMKQRLPKARKKTTPANAKSSVRESRRHPRIFANFWTGTGRPDCSRPT